MSPIEADSNVNHAWVTALSQEETDDLMNSTLASHQLADLINEVDVVITFAKSKLKSFIGKEGGCINAERLQAQV